VEYSTADGSATAGEDYAVTSGTLSFGPGVTQQAVTVPILDDTLSEPNETLELVLDNVVRGTLALPDYGTLSILDDDAGAGLPVLSITGGSVNEDSGIAILMVMLDASPAPSVTVAYHSEDGTATAGDDYEPVSGTLIFEEGVRQQALEVTILEDEVTELAESLTIRLTNPLHAVLSPVPAAILTILDNDGGYTVFLPAVLRASIE
jgi:hypothetical protein